MKFLTMLAGLLLLAPALAAGEGDPPPPKDPPKPLTPEQIAEAERLADAIMREEMPMMAISDEDRATYLGHMETVRQELAAAMPALKARDRMGAGGHYVRAQKAFAEIPREAGPALGEDYHKMAKAMLAFARLLLELELAAPVDPGAPDKPSPPRDVPSPPRAAPPPPSPKDDPVSNKTPPAKDPGGDPAKGIKDFKKP